MGFRWYHQKSPEAAERWLAGITNAINSLTKFPERHPIDEDESELFEFPIRQMLYGRRPNVDRVLFAVEGNTVSVIAIRHCAQGPIEP